MRHFPIHFPHYFKTHVPRQIEELYLTVGLMDLAGAAITLFEPIYLWSLGYRIPDIMLFYIIVYGAYFFLVPLGGAFVARFGHERSILISTVWLAGYVAGLISIENAAWMFYVTPILFALQKTFYWPAYHYDFMRFSPSQERGSEFSALSAISTLMFVLGPVTGGLITKFFGFQALFLGAMVIILLSSIPLFTGIAPRQPEKYSYWKSFTLPFRRRYWKNTLGYLGLGEELIVLTVWPIFILLTVADLFNVGLIVGGSALLTAIMTLMIGKWTDRIARKRVLSVGGLATAAVWGFRMLLRSAPALFALDMFGRLAMNTRLVSMTALTYDRTHPDDYSWHGVLYEQGFAFAKLLIAILVIALVSIADPFHVAFALAGIFSLFYLVF